MKRKITKTIAAVLTVLMILSSISIVPLSAADYRNGAQSGPSASYAGGRYYRNYKRVPITGDNRTDLIAIALSQLGYQEGAGNGAFSGEVSGGSNYVEFSYNMGDLGLGYGGSDYPWCASFVSWCLYQSRCTNHGTYSYLARNHMGDYTYIWKEISCAMWVNQLKGAGYFSYSAGMGGSYTPKYGDLVFFKSSSSPSHIGICLYVKDGVLYTVEGNTSDASGLETNGGGVYFKSYSLSSSYLYGYGRLPYNSNSSVTKIDYSGANPTPGLYVANAAKYIYSSEYSTSAVTTIPRFSMFEITRVGANNRLYGTFTDVNGNTVTGWVENNSSRIIQLSCSGVMSGAWEFDGKGFKYKYADGTYAAKGWLQDPENKAWYYIGTDGYAQNGWLYLSTGTFYLDPNSNAMLTGHRYIDNRWYYFNNDGYLCDGSWEFDGAGYRYRYIDGTYGINCWLDDATNNYVRYYLDANGYSVRGWQKIGDVWYYFDPNSAALLSGWLYIDNEWYYTDSSGAMQTGWIELDGAYYYLDSSGARVSNTTTNINGSSCTFDENGVLISGTIIEETETPAIGNKYESYTQGMPADGTGTVYAHGVDISKWNNGDDWTTLKLNLAGVKAAGIDFVIIRCGSTNKGKDPMFELYYNECKRLGLDVGAYFYSYALDAAGAVSDAQKCLSYIEGKQFEYPIYMDYEDPTQETLSNAKAAEICTAFLDTVAAGGYITGIYSYKSWFERGWVDSSGIRSKYEGWVTYPVKSMNHSNYDAEFSKSYGMYQYTFEYVIDNVGKFDANVCYKDYPTIVKTYGFNNYAPTAGPQMSASWVIDDNGLRYQYSDGTYAPPGWLWDGANSAWYYLDQNGYAVSGWVEDGGKMYYLDPNSNAMLTGHRYIDNKWYYFDASGAMVTTGMWYQDANGFKYQMGDGSFVYSGWVDDPTSGARYYMDANGYAVSGFQTIDGTLYYFFTDSNALFRDSWVTLADGKVYRAAPDGAILKGFQYIDGEYFYFDSNGAMQTGFVNLNNVFYYFDTDGTMVTGWFTSPKSGYIYHFDEEGKMNVGWYEENGDWYFFEDNMDNHYGQMLTGWITSSASGYKYYLAEDGKMVTGWQEIDGNTYYFDGNDESFTGKMVTGEKEIDGETYLFDDNGVLVVKCKVEFVDYDGTVLSTQMVNKSGAATAPADPVRTGYTFIGWDKDFSNITGDIVVTAQYKLNTYTVKFVDYNGTVIDTQTVNYGSAATAPADPVRNGFKFAGWDVDFSNITSDLTVTAMYAEETVNLLADFNGWSTDEGNMKLTSDNIFTMTVELEAGIYEFKILTGNVWYGNNGTIDDTTLATSQVGWEMVDGAGNCKLNASGGTYTFNYNYSTRMLEVLYKTTEYKVTFKDYDGTVLKTETVKKGESANAPANPARQGYTFKGWDTDFSNVTADITVTAVYEKNATITATGRLQIEVTGGTGFTISMNGGLARPQGTTYVNTKVPVGTNVTVVATTTNGNAFVGWMNPTTGVIVSTEETFTFNTSANTYYKAMYKTDVEGVNLVTFKNANAAGGKGQIIDVQYYAPGEDIVVPDSLSMAGYNFGGWDHSVDEIKEKISGGTDVDVLATWNSAPVYVYIEAEGGTITANNGQNELGQYRAYKATTITANDAPEGMKFAYWLAISENADGTESQTVKSYDKVYTFYPSSDIKLKAVYVEESEEINQTVLADISADNTTEGNYITYILSWNVPEHVGNFISGGILIVKAENYNADTFVVGSSDGNVIENSPKAAQTAKLSGYGLNKKDSFIGTSWVAKSWVQYESNGEIITVYSDEISITK